jgi:hypothetical protein
LSRYSTVNGSSAHDLRLALGELRSVGEVGLYLVGLVEDGLDHVVGRQRIEVERVEARRLLVVSGDEVVPLVPATTTSSSAAFSLALFPATTATTARDSKQEREDGREQR